MRDWLESLAFDAQPTLEDCIEQLGEILPLLNELKNTEQDSQWHAEGDVHIHTNMVLTELFILLAGEANHIAGWRRQSLILAAALHDIAKPLTTKRVLINGVERVTARGHEDVGRSYLAQRLIELPLDYQVIHCVLGLVGEHQKPKLLVIKEKSAGSYFRLARLANTELLYWLELADMRGRVCVDKSEQIDYLELFKLQAQEFGCWSFDTTYPHWQQEISNQLSEYSESLKSLTLMNGIRDYEDGQIFSVEEAIAKSYGARNGFAELIVMCGPSGSGKSSVIRKLPDEYQVISMDDIRQKMTGQRSNQKQNGQVRQLAKEQLKAGLRSMRKIIWDAANIRTDFRDPLIQLAKNYGALVTLLVIVKPESVLKKDNRDRAHPVPDDVLNNQLQRWQWPVEIEADRYVVIGSDKKILHARGWVADVVDKNKDEEDALEKLF